MSPALSVKSSCCAYSSSIKPLQYSRNLSSSCSVKRAAKYQSLHMCSSFVCSLSQIIRHKRSVPKSRQQERLVGGLSITMMSFEAGVGVLGTKLGTMSYFQDNGTVVPVTVIGFKEGNIVTQVKTEATDAYDAVQVGYERVRNSKLTKPELGRLNKSGIIPLRNLQEFQLVSVDGFYPNQKLQFEDLFKVT